MKLKNKLIILFFLPLLLLTQACKKDKTLGLLEGRVTDALSGLALPDVRIVVYDANSNAPTDFTVFTNSAGEYSIEITEGSYYLRLSKQGYNSVPPPAFAPIPVNVTAKQTTVTNYSMNPSALIGAGYISGNVSAGNEVSGGVLVVATSGQNAYSATSDADGNYVIYNVPAGSYSLQAWKSGFNSNTVSANVSASSETANVNLSLTSGASGSVSGQITFLATTNIEVDVALIHPLTKEVIPGLNTVTSGQNYTITNVPNGIFIARASFENDSKVVDPDWLIKNGEPSVTIASNPQTVDFSCTGAVTLSNPTNTADVQPFIVSGTTPVFSWDSYSSSSDYIIEVTDANGNLIWGGFDKSGTLPVKNIVIPSSQTSIQFNSDGNALAALQPGQVYRWRIYASKDAQQEATGWKLISVSEDQKGLIKIEN